MTEVRQEPSPDIWHSAESGMVMLDITDAVGVLEPVVIEGESLFPKDEYHTTLVSIRREQGEQDVEGVFVEDFRQFLETTDVSLASIGDERYLCRKEDECTVIAPVRLVGERALKEFVRGYFPEYDPFFHVTLLKNAATEHGIRISSAKDLADRCEVLSRVII